MEKYLKIETIYNRDIEGTKKLIENSFRDSAVEFLKLNTWVWTEKVDGTNIRIFWDGHNVEFGGRTDKANIPSPLVNYLNSVFKTPEAEEIFEQMFGEKEVTLFGEGYGNKIQAVGKDYIADGVGFIMFDVFMCGNYQERSRVEETAKAFGVPVVPIVGEGNLYKAVDFVKSNPKSTLGTCDMEGIVCRPKIEMRDRCGKRIIVKIKWNDFRRLGYKGMTENEDTDTPIAILTSLSASV